MHLLFEVHPTKHGIISQCWLNAGPPSATLAQHSTNRWFGGLFAGDTLITLGFSGYITVGVEPSRRWRY